MTSILRRNPIILFGFLFILLVFLVVAQFLLPPNFAKGDFIQFWVAGRMNWSGQNPYDTAEWVNMRFIHGNSWIPDRIFNYPLPLARLLAPIGLLPLYPAFLVWDSLTLIYIFIIILLIFEHVELSLDLKYFAPIVLGTLMLRPTIVVLRNGQITGLLLLIIFTGTYLMVKRRTFWSGFILGLVMIKPQIGLGIVLFFSFWSLLQKKWRYFYGLFLVEIFLFLMGYSHNSSWVRLFLTESGNKISGYSSYSPTFWGLMDFIFKGDSQLSVISAAVFSLIFIAFLVNLLIHWREKLSAIEAISLIIPIVLIVTPYIWSYDHLVLLIPLVWISCLLIKMGKPYLFSAMFLPVTAFISILLIILAMQLEKDIFAVFFPILIFGFNMFILKHSQDELHKVVV